MRVVLWIFAIIGLLTTLMMTGLIFFAASHLHPAKPVLADQIILKLDLTKSYSEVPPAQGLASLVEEKQGTFRQLIGTIRRAGADPHVKGIFAQGGSSSFGIAQIQELRDAIGDFRQHRKFAYLFADSFGELSSGTGPYLLASAFDQIWLQPIGGLGLVGVSLQAPFIRGALDKIGITPDFSRRGEFKSAETELTETHMPASDKLAFDGLASNLFDQIVDGVATSRRITPSAARELIDNGPYTGQQALDRHLVDHLGYQDEAESAARNQAPQADMVALEDYRETSAGRAPTGGRNVVALVYATGIVASGKAQSGALGPQMGADDLADALRDASKRRDVRAIVLRINSPGGSDVASETIWRATQLARRAGKPLVVSMGNEAASGGYYIAAGADKIVAEPGTLTGSIGVFGGKIVFGGLWDKLGVNWDGINYGRNAAIGSTVSTFTPEQRLHFDAMLDESYQTFKARVAAGRHMDPARVEEIARGRVWTGAQAREIGLVDQLGGLKEAIEAARTLARLRPDDSVTIEGFPKPKNMLQELLKSVRSGTLPSPLNSDFMGSLDHLSQLATIAATLTGHNGAAMMQPLELH